MLVRDIPGNAAIVTDRRTGLLFSSPEVYEQTAAAEDLSLWLIEVYRQLNVIAGV